VITATDNDELDWIEWKIGKFLASKEDYAKLSRHILGMANRKPRDAARQVGGCGYIIVGAGAGACDGVPGIDPAKLDDGIQAYLGSEGPTWGPQVIDRQGKSVLVVTVEPPQPGDHMFLLMKDYDKYYGGQIFVRRHGKTQRALPGEIRALEDRRAAGERAVDLQVRPAASDGIAAVQSFGHIGPILDRWIETRRAELIPESMHEAPPAPDPKTEARHRGFRMAPELDSLAASYGRSYYQSATSPDTRTKAQYISEVEEYLKKCRAHYTNVAFMRHAVAGGNQVCLNLVNGGQSFYKEISINIRITGASILTVSDLPEPKPPRPPDKLGTPAKHDFPASIFGLRNVSMNQIGIAEPPHPQELTVDAATTTISYVIPIVRAEDTIQLAPFLAGWKDTESIEAEWTIKPGNAHGLARGTFTLKWAASSDPTVLLPELLPTDPSDE
jgi:hypothetical protein